ncbi:MAG: hypothetical protein JXQ65_00985 [Candidatus Marinimicrobia bacterium]|nr:hypothetical protein [Candidatus Neomarinimicrobiota bacterium]
MLCFLLSFIGIGACSNPSLSYTNNNLKIEIKTGAHWLHEFPILFGIKKENPPQFAIWLEDTLGNYLSTIYVTSKIANESWLANGDNRRQEALPHWCFQRGVKYTDGLYLPTKENPFTDCITGATPKTNKTIQLDFEKVDEPVVIKAEFNHSTDWNDYFPEKAKKGNANYSGGKGGSGQPAIVYSDTIDYQNSVYQLELIGRSSADGSTGDLYNDFEKLTSAKEIIESIKVEVVE